MSGRRCITAEWKRLRSKIPRTAAAGAPPAVFSGTIVVVGLELGLPKGTARVDPADLGVVVQYLGRAAPAIQAYCAQYGPAHLAVAPAVLPFRVPLAVPSYSDAQLQQWVDQISTTPGFPPDGAPLILNPPGATNTDAKESGGVGVLGYHGKARVPYSFVNPLGSGFSVGDSGDLFAEAVSHEIAEMTVDPNADGSQPEVCDGCGTNCQGNQAFRVYFASDGRYLGGGASFPPPFAYDHFLSTIARPAAAALCPAPQGSCVYPPP